MNWQPISTAPKDGTAIWAGWWDSDTFIPGCNQKPAKFFKGRWWEPNEDYPLRPPTHWMPLPPPPKD